MKTYFYRITGGLFLLAVGILIWLSNFNILHIKWSRDWPVILIALGLCELIKHIFQKKN